MDTVTYPHPDVVGFVNPHFSAIKINLLERHPDFRVASGGARIPWAPTLIFTDPQGRELRRYVGWLPPQSFVAELHLVRGILGVGRGRFAEAKEHLAQIERRFAASEAAAEGLYWQGIAGFLEGKRDMSALADCWNRLIEEYPGTRFATHASVIEDWPG